MSGYDPKKAETYNKLRQNGLFEWEAASLAGIDPNDNGNYVVGTNGQMGPVIAGIGPNDAIITAADRDAAANTDPTFRQVPFAEKADSAPGAVTTNTPVQPPSVSNTAVAAAPPIFTPATSTDADLQPRPVVPAAPPIFTPATSTDADLQPRPAAATAVQSPAPAPVQVAPVAEPTVPALTVRPDPDTEDPAARQADITAAVAQADQVGQGANTAPAVVNRTIDPGLGEGLQTVVAGQPTTSPSATADVDRAVPTGGEAAVAPVVISPATNGDVDRGLAAGGEAAFGAPTAVAPVVISPATNGDVDRGLAAGGEAAFGAPTAVAPEPVANNNNGTPAAPPVGPSVAMLEPPPVDPNGTPAAPPKPALNPAVTAAQAGSATQTGVNQAQRQSTLQSRKVQPAAADWRVRIQLAAGADYLYNAKDADVLAPLATTDGVIFPYTPAIETNYKAKYTPYDLIHSNYRGYFYQNSSVDEISVKGTFTAQDTLEAQYLLAVIHFFRSVTKMFYGQDAQAGTPPPLVYLSGLGQFQFNNHPCLVSNFNYSLPTDVDYIRARGFNNIGLNMENRRQKSSGPSAGGGFPSLAGVALRLINNALTKGAEKKPPVPGAVTQNVTNQNSVNSTYVPTKMDISVTLLPIQTRNQVSQQFSLAGFAQGRLLQGGFW